MKKKILTLSTLVFSFSASANPSLIVDKEIAIPVQKILAPSQGYDDNDLVQIVVDGLLPNACYQQGKTDLQVDAQNKEIKVIQYAFKKQDGICSTNNLPSELNIPIPFMAEITLGQLEVGSYTLVYQSPQGELRRKLGVDRAPVTTIDSLNYATVTNAYIPDYVEISEAKVKITLSGILNSSCTKISENIPSVVVDDVIVLLPQVDIVGEFCLPLAKNFTKEYYLDVPKAGRYLLHVRSVNGKAINRLFSVLNN